MRNRTTLIAVVLTVAMTMLLIASSAVADWPVEDGSSPAIGSLSPDCQELLANGDFEAGSFPPWDGGGNIGLGPGHNSAYGAWLGDADNAEGELRQGVTIPADANSVQLEFWWLAESASEQPGDVVEVIVQYDEQADWLHGVWAEEPLGQWRLVTVDLIAYAGQTVLVTFSVHTDGEAPSTFRLDDVSLRACGAVTPDHLVYLPLTLRNYSLSTLIFSDDFDDGTLTNWTPNLGTWTNPGTYMRGEYALGNAWNVHSSTGSDIVYEGTVNLLSGNAVGLVFRSSADGTSSYDVILDAVVNVFKISKRTPYQVLASYPMTVQRNHPYTVKVVANGSTIEAYLDGVKRLTVTDSTYSSGQLGVVLFQATATYDDLQAWETP